MILSHLAKKKPLLDVCAFKAPSVAPRSLPEAKGKGRLPFLFLTVLLCSIFQFYVLPPVGGIYIPLYLIAVYALALKGNWLRAGRTRIGLLLIALFAVQIVSLAWSPSVFTGIRDLLFSFPFLIVYLYVYKEIQKNPAGIWRAVRIYCLVALVQSALVVLFRFAPMLKESFWHLPITDTLINPNGLAAFFSSEGRNNTYDVAKSGGFMLNANVAGVWAGILFYLSIAAANVRKKTFWIIICLIHLGAILTCGSKAALGFLFLVPFMLLWLYPWRKSYAFAYCLFFLLIGSTYFFLPSIQSQSSTNDSYVSASSGTLQSRIELWKYAGHKFIDSPILGQGYGGWNFSVMDVQGAAAGLDVKTGLPPHNALIILWTQSGFFAVLIGCFLWWAIIKNALQFRKIKGKLFIGFFGGYIVFLLHSLGENYGIFGEAHMTAVLALIVGSAAGTLASMKNAKNGLKI